MARQAIKTVHLERHPHREAMVRLRRVYQLLQQAADAPPQSSLAQPRVAERETHPSTAQEVT